MVVINVRIVGLHWHVINRCIGIVQSVSNAHRRQSYANRCNNYFVHGITIGEELRIKKAMRNLSYFLAKNEMKWSSVVNSSIIHNSIAGAEPPKPDDETNY